MSLLNKYGAKLAKRDGGWYCFYCHYPLVRILSNGLFDPDCVKCRSYGPIDICTEKIGYTFPSIDHRIPKSKGGKHNIENLVLACQICNGRKHIRAESEFREKFLPEILAQRYG